VERWFDLWRSTAAWTWGGPVAGPLWGDPRQLRGLWMTQATRAIDRYMRSSSFLGLMHESLAAMTRAARLGTWFPLG
jgi:hypothetical protein